MTDIRKDEVRGALEELLEGGLRLARSAAHSHNGFRAALDAVQLAANAAKEDDHDSACKLLSQNIVLPLAESLKTMLPALISDAMQKSIEKSFPRIIKATLRQKLIEEIVRDLAEKTVAGYMGERGELERSIQSMALAVQASSATVARVIEANRDELVPSLAAPGFGARMQEDSAVKADIGRRVAEVFYTGGSRPTFVMASSTAVHLGQQLRRMPDVVSTRFGTNSIAFPLAVLNDRSQHQVWTWCGPNYDDQCGGWWPVLGDDAYFGALATACSPMSHGFTTAILTPRRLSVEHGLHFSRAESVRMARVLLDSAAEIIVMLPAERVCQILDSSERAGALPTGGNWRRLNKPVHLVIAGQKAGTDIGEIGNSFAEKGADVHYQLEESSEWHVVSKGSG